jgi:heptosyltransferase-2
MTEALLIAPQWIGDAVMSEPLLADLAARGERITVAALPWVAPVYRAMPAVAAVESLPFAHGRLDWSARRALARQWRGRFAAAYVLPNSLKAALLPWLAGVPRRVGYLGESRYLLLNRRLANPAGRPPMVDFYRALAQVDGAPIHVTGHAAEGAAVASAATPHLSLAPFVIEQALARHGLRPRTYLVFGPGAEYGPAKCWPADHYATLARQLHAERGLQVVLLGSAKEAALAATIAQAAGPGSLPLAGATSLDEAMALIAGAAGLVSNDSGLMHVAAAFGLPQVAVFGSSSPEHTPPLNARARVLWLKHEIGLECSPCFERVCRFGHTRCLVEISPQRVAEALTSTLDH